MVPRQGASDTGPSDLVPRRGLGKLSLIGRHNGKVVQESTTDMLIFPIDNIVSYVTVRDARPR